MSRRNNRIGLQIHRVEEEEVMVGVLHKVDREIRKVVSIVEEMALQGEERSLEKS